MKKVTGNSKNIRNLFLTYLFFLGCEHDHYGLNCAETCGHCETGNSCDRINGYCPCNWAYGGDTCKIRKFCWFISLLVVPS